MGKKVKLLLLLLLMCTCLYNNDLIAQNTELEEDTKEKIINKLSVTPHVGWLHSWGDFRTESFMPNFLDPDENKLGYGLRLNYDLSKVFKLSTGFLAGELRGTHEMINTANAVTQPSGLGLGIFYETDMFEFTLPRVDFNLSRFIFKDESKLFNKLSFNLFLSHGLVYYNSQVYAVEDEGVELQYSKQRGRSGKTVEAVTSYGAEVSYVLNDRFDVNLGTSIRNVWNDKLDAWVSDGSLNDKFSYTYVGVSYYFKKRDYIVKTFDEEEDKLLAKEERVVEEEEEEEKEEEVEIIEEPKKEVVEEVKKEIVEEPKKEEVKKVVEEVKKEEPKKVEKKEPAPTIPTDFSLYEGDGKFVIVSAYRGMERAVVDAKSLKEKGENPIIVKNRTNTWYLVAIARYDDKAVALEKMREARTNGYDKSWVLLKPLD